MRLARIGMRSDLAPRAWQFTPLKDIISVDHGFGFRGEFFRDDGPDDMRSAPGNFAIGGGLTWSSARLRRSSGRRFVLEPGCSSSR